MRIVKSVALALAISIALGMNLAARADAILTGSGGATAVGPYPVSWSVTVDDSISILATYFLCDTCGPTGSPYFAGPANQNPANVLSAVQAIPGLSGATLAGITNTGVYTTGTSPEDSDITNVLGNVYAVHFGGGGGGANSNDLVFFFSGITDFTANFIHCCGNDGNRVSNIRAFNTVAVPGPIVGAGLPGLIFAAGGLIALARRRRQRLA